MYSPIISPPYLEERQIADGGDEYIIQCYKKNCNKIYKKIYSLSIKISSIFMHINNAR